MQGNSGRFKKFRNSRTRKEKERKGKKIYGMSLRILGGGALVSTGFLFGCSETSVRNGLSDVMSAILSDDRVGPLDCDPENDDYLS